MLSPPRDSLATGDAERTVRILSGAGGEDGPTLDLLAALAEAGEPDTFPRSSMRARSVAAESHHSFVGTSSYPRDPSRERARPSSRRLWHKMKTEKTPLEEAFLEDHRHLTHGLARIREALRTADDTEAARTADEVDRVVGPHMRFEEEVFYPKLVEKLGGDFVDQLYGEHEIGQSAVKALVGLKPEERLTEGRRKELLDEVGTALQHARSCGTLLSHIADLDESEHRAMLQKLKKLRGSGIRWTDVATERSRAQAMD